jgi:exonuclease SbcD
MGFKKEDQEKMVVVAESGPGSEFRTTEVPVPCFRQLLRLKGELGEVEARLQEVCLAGNPVWVDVILEDNSVPANVYERLREMTSHTGVQILRVNKKFKGIVPPIEEGECLEDLSETVVFSRRLDAAKITGEKRKDLMDAFAEILVSIREEDSLAEGSGR